MATAQLGTFSYDMVLNYAKWTDQLSKAERAAEKSTAAIQKSISGAVDRIGDGLTDIAGKLAAGFTAERLVEFGKQAIETADQINKMSQKVGISVESLSALNTSAKLSDVAVDSLQAGLAKLTKNAADAAAGGKESSAVFAAMGVSLKDSNGQLKSTEDILVAVATKFAGYEDSAAKTALAQRVFGKSGADLIPLLAQLEGGLGKAREEAAKYGQIISGQTAAQAEEFNDNLTRLTLAASGFANAVVRDVLPDLVELSAKFADASSTTDGYRDKASGVVIVVRELIQDVGDLSSKLSELPGEVRSSAQAFSDWTDQIAGTRGEMGKLLELLPKVKKEGGSGLFDFPKGEGGLLPGVQAARDFFSFINTPSGINDKFTKDLTNPFKDLTTTLEKIAPVADIASTSFDGLAQHVDSTAKISTKARAPLVSLGDSAEKSAKSHRSLADATREYTAALASLNQIAQRTSDGNQDLRDRIAGADDAQIQFNQTMREAQAAYDIAVDGANTSAAAVEALSRTTEAARERIDLTRTLDEQREGMRKYQEELQKTADMWGSWADAVFDAVTKSGNFLKNLLSNLKDVVTQMLREWFRTSVIGTFTGSGGGYGGLVQAGMGLIGAGSSNSAIFGAGVDPTASASGNSTDLVGMGRTIWGGFQNGYQSFFSGSDAFTMGPPDASGATSSYYGGGYQSGFGQALGIAGGVYAGYNRYQQSGGGIGGIAGGAAYGYGTYAAGAAIATTAATGSLAAGLAAIPVVGWIALAAMVIDMASGGKLFGTKGKFNFGKQQTFIDSNGATTVAGYDMKGQKALFGGSTHSWHDLPVDDATQKAWNDFVTQLITGNNNLADQLGTKAGEIVSAEFDAVFDKKGNVTSTNSIVGGVTYNEDQQAFQTRVVAETMLNTLDMFSAGISAAVEQYRADAQQLMAVTQSLAGAAVYIKQGGNFLALGSDQSLTALLALAQGAQQFGESIDQTLQRIVQAQQQYDQFVGQFKVQTFASPFQAAIADIASQLQSNIATANAYAKAAGAEGASTQDLVNIHKYAAAQFAAAVAQLKINANSLVVSLGYGMPNTLDAINAKIAELEGSAANGASAVGGFSNAMSQAASAAQNAMNLLLGDLSPLNDQAKLQTALAGLRAGTVTAEQVLEIGRRLYATGSDYNALFAQVTAMARGGTAAVGSTGGGNNGSSNAAELSRLKEQRDKLQAQQDHADALALAQQIADLVSAEGISVDDALKEVGLTDLPAFMKELGVTNKDGFDKFIENLEKNTDSAGDNTADIVSKLDYTNLLLEQIRDGAPGGGTHATGGDGRGGGAGEVAANTEALNANTQAMRGHNQGNRSTRTNPRALLAAGGR